MKIQKANLAELKGTLHKRGRARYENPELKQALAAMLKDGEDITIDELFVVTPKTTAKAITNEKAKWRNRIVSVFESLNSGQKVSVSWTDKNEALVSLVRPEA